MGWKIYFWLILVIAVISYPVVIVTKFNLWILIDIVLWIITFMGLYSYAYKKKILNEKFWRIWLFVIIPWDVASILIIFDIESSITERLINWSFVIPAYIALFLLGFKSQSLWEGELMKMNDQEKKYDGIGRIAFLAIFLGFPFFIGVFAATLIPMFPDVSEEFISVLSILIMVLFAIVLFVAAVLRMKNIGYSQWWGVLMLVPGINGFFLIYCFVVPEGYADRKSSYGVFVRKLIPIAIIIIIISPFIIIFVPQNYFWEIFVL